MDGLMRSWPQPGMPSWVYPISKRAGLWPLVRSMRLAWLEWLSSQLAKTDARQRELILERDALERLP
jgi:hypothetical protein